MFKLHFFKSKFFYLICLLFFSFSNNAQKSLRIGYVNMDYILENLDDYKTATEEYELRLNIWKKEISEREGEIENKLKELEIQKPLLTVLSRSPKTLKVFLLLISWSCKKS